MPELDNNGLSDPALYSFGIDVASIGANSQLKDAIKEIRAWRRLFEIDGLEVFKASIIDKRIEIKIECPMVNSSGDSIGNDGLIVFMHRNGWRAVETGPKYMGSFKYDISTFQGIFVRYDWSIHCISISKQDYHK